MLWKFANTTDSYCSCAGVCRALQAIVAQPLTVTGSIGVVTGKLNLSELYERVGYNKTLLSRGKFAEFLSADNRWGAGDLYAAGMLVYWCVYWCVIQYQHARPQAPVWDALTPCKAHGSTSLSLFSHSHWLVILLWQAVDMELMLSLAHAGTHIDASSC